MNVKSMYNFTHKGSICKDDIKLLKTQDDIKLLKYYELKVKVSFPINESRFYQK